MRSLLSDELSSIYIRPHFCLKILHSYHSTLSSEVPSIYVHRAGLNNNCTLYKINGQTKSEPLNQWMSQRGQHSVLMQVCMYACMHAPRAKILNRSAWWFLHLQWPFKEWKISQHTATKSKVCSEKKKQLFLFCVFALLFLAWFGFVFNVLMCFPLWWWPFFLDL